MILDNVFLRKVAVAIKNGHPPSDIVKIVAEKPCWDVLHDHPDMLDRMIVTLDDDLIVMYLRTKLRLHRCRWTKTQRTVRHGILSELTAAVATRDDSWEKYEMYRRFIDFDNVALKIAKS